MKRLTSILFTTWALALVVGVLCGLSSSDAKATDPPYLEHLQKRNPDGGKVELPPYPCSDCRDSFTFTPPGGDYVTCFLTDCTVDWCIYTCFEL